MAPSTPAVQALTRAGIPHSLHRYPHDPAVTAFGREAAEALGTDPGRVFKTLVATVDDELVVAVVPVTDELDLKALAGQLGAKRARLADPAAAEKATGYVVGGISPVGQRRQLTTLVDDAATGWPSVFVSGGRRGLEIELAPEDLLRATGGRSAPIARPR